MPNTREKLIELLEDRRLEASEVCGSMNKGFGAWYADHLIANGVTVNEWISVKDRLPEEGETVLVFGYWHEKFQPLMCYLSPHRKGEWFTTVAGQHVYTVTHWMPLPQPPKGE